MRDCSDINQTIRELRDENVIYHFSRDYLRNVMKDAADAIEELLAELVTIRNQLPKWVSAEDELGVSLDELVGRTPPKEETDG